MAASRQKNEQAQAAARKIRWLTALERELKSRVGWVDEAVSPFAGRKRTEPVSAKIRPELLPGERAA